MLATLNHMDSMAYFLSVIPVKTGIHIFPCLDSRFRGSDDPSLIRLTRH